MQVLHGIQTTHLSPRLPPPQRPSMLQGHSQIHDAISLTDKTEGVKDPDWRTPRLVLTKDYVHKLHGCTNLQAS